MFENLLQFWKGKDFLKQVLENFKDMLDDTHIMFDSVCKKLINNEEEPELKNNVYSIDRQVNDLQKDIRKRVIEHLSIQPSKDVPICLLLMSVVKDAERLGDYAKNLYEVTTMIDNPLNRERYRELFNNLEEEISELFKETTKAFIESDEAKAAKAWEYKTKISTRCDQTIEKLAKSNLTVNEAVCFTLIARYFKRITAHLTNIATSVILPLTDLDYFDEKRRET
ncbi:MAG: hypothetical protein KAS05_02255 [Candidatus Omnitrophica bacterium]|nr:hypothetical protein [Candidatus Omnitrophota bacterium]